MECRGARAEPRRVRHEALEPGGSAKKARAHRKDVVAKRVDRDHALVRALNGREGLAGVVSVIVETGS